MIQLYFSFKLSFSKTTMLQFFLWHYYSTTGKPYGTFRKELTTLFLNKEFSDEFGKKEKYLTEQQFELLKEKLL